MSQLEERLNINVCLSDGERKPLAPSGDNQGQRAIDGINTEQKHFLFVFWLFLAPLCQFSSPYDSVSLVLTMMCKIINMETVFGFTAEHKLNMTNSSQDFQ